MFFGVQFIKIFQMLFNKKYCFKNIYFFFFTPNKKIVIRTESWVKNRDTNRIVGLVYRYSPIWYRYQWKSTILCTNFSIWYRYQWKSTILCTNFSIWYRYQWKSTILCNNFSIWYRYQWKSTFLCNNFSTKAKHKNMLIKKTNVLLIHSNKMYKNQYHSLCLFNIVFKFFHK